MSTKHPTDVVLDRLNPFPASPTGPEGLDERARTDLATILRTTPAADPSVDPDRDRGPGRRRRLTLCGAAVVALTLVAAVVVPGLGHREGVAYAATPKPLVFVPVATGEDAPELLRTIAARTAALPDQSGPGRYAHVEMRSWDLFTTIDGEQVTSEVVPQRTSRWVATDGSGRIRVTSHPSSGTHREDRRGSSGEFSLYWPLRSLSSDDATLAAQLEIAHPVDENGPGERFAAVIDAYRETPLSPAVRAAVLRYIAATPGLMVTGTVTDRAGRDGIGFSLDSDYSGLPTRYTLIIDPDDGKLLSSEDMLTTTAGKLPVPVPSVTGYIVFLFADFTHNTR